MATSVKLMFTIPIITVCVIGLPMPIDSKMRGAKYSTALMPTNCWNTLSMQPMKMTMKP